MTYLNQGGHERTLCRENEVKTKGQAAPSHKKLGKECSWKREQLVARQARIYCPGGTETSCVKPEHIEEERWHEINLKRSKVKSCIW